MTESFDSRHVEERYDEGIILNLIHGRRYCASSVPNILFRCWSGSKLLESLQEIYPHRELIMSPEQLENLEIVLYCDFCACSH
jgi:hypothetical protein